MGLGQQVDTAESHVEAIDLLSNHVPCESGIALAVAVYSVLKRMPVQKLNRPHSQPKIFHDFRRSAAYELWKAGSNIEERMEVTGHRCQSMFKRYADLFSDEERRSMQRKAQERPQEWRQAERERAAQAPDTSVAEGARREPDSGRVQ